MIYVDQIRHYPECKLSWKHWCHMVSDTSLQELHDMALQLGLKKSYFQSGGSSPHYDLTPAKRELAIKFGATELNEPREFFRISRILKEVKRPL